MYIKNLDVLWKLRCVLYHAIWPDQSVMLYFVFAASSRLSLSRCICCWSFTRWYNFSTCSPFSLFLSVLPGHPCLNFFAESDTPHPCRIPTPVSDSDTRVGFQMLFAVSQKILTNRTPAPESDIDTRTRVHVTLVFICLTTHCFIHPSWHLLLPVNSIVDDGESDEQVVLVSQSGTVNRIKVKDISIQSRYARWVRCYIKACSLFDSFRVRYCDNS